MHDLAGLKIDEKGKALYSLGVECGLETVNIHGSDSVMNWLA